MKKRKRRKHICKPATASEIIRDLGISKKTLKEVASLKFKMPT